MSASCSRTYSITPQVVAGEEKHSWECIYLACYNFSRFLITWLVSPCWATSNEQISSGRLVVDYFTGFPAARSGTCSVNASLCSAALDHTSEGQCLWLNLSLGLESLAMLYTSKRILAIIKLLHKLLLQAGFILSLCLGMTDSFSKVNILQGDLLVCVNTEGKMSK